LGFRRFRHGLENIIGIQSPAITFRLVSAFVARLDGVLPWDAAAVDETTKIRVELAKLGTPIGDNVSAIAGHALCAGAVIVTNNVREFMRVPNLRYEDWTVSGS
jgi:tRNA(fMet)-specific endonuclease VapC